MWIALQQWGKPVSAADEPLSSGALEPIHGWRTFFTFALPAICDAGATTLLNVGLYYTCATSHDPHAPTVRMTLYHKTECLAGKPPVSQPNTALTRCIANACLAC